MALTDAMEDVDYGRHNFNENEALAQHPLWMTESHFVYNLDRDAGGHLAMQKDSEGEPLCTPRLLKDLVMQKVVVKPSRMKKLVGSEVPSALYPSLLREAIFQRSLQTVSHLISTWPREELDVGSVLPAEDLGSCQQPSLPWESTPPGGMTLLDAFMVGLLNLKSTARLKVVNFGGFKHDRKISRELARLPLLWMRPSDRQPAKIHKILKKSMGVSLEKVEQYLTHITEIYASIDLLVKHGHEMGPITVLFDCKITTEDVPIGLSLQKLTPFRFLSQRVWTEPIAYYDVPITLIKTVLDPATITHLEVEDPDACKDNLRWLDVLETILAMPALRTLSLPNTVHVDQLPEALSQISTVVGRLLALRKLNLSSCNLKDSLERLLSNVSISYLGLRDCRLGGADIEALLKWPKLPGLQEVNLSRNNLAAAVPALLTLLDKMAATVVCFSLSYASLSLCGLQQVVAKCKECRSLKILSVQSFVPPALDEMTGLLKDMAAIPSLQRCILLPEAYAFPGSQISQRTTNREEVLTALKDVLVKLGRPDIELE